MPTLRERTVVIVQARMDSTRLPGKVLMPVPRKEMARWRAGRMMGVLLHRLRRLEDERQVGKLLVATTTRAVDSSLCQLVRACGVGVWAEAKADPEDVLSRYVGAARGFETIVRVTADCPLLCPTVVACALCWYEWQRPLGVEYVYTSRDWPDGMDVEVFSSRALRLADEHATDPAEREHVTLWMRRSPTMAEARSEFPCPARWGDLRVTLDTPADYEVICNVLRELGSDCRLPDIVQLWRDKPELFEPNRELAEQRDLSLCEPAARLLNRLPY